MERTTCVENTSEKKKKKKRERRDYGKRYLRGTVRTANPAQHVHRRFENSIHPQKGKKEKKNGRDILKRYDSPPIHVHMMSGKSFWCNPLLLYWNGYKEGRKEGKWAGGWTDDKTDVRLARTPLSNHVRRCFVYTVLPKSKILHALLHQWIELSEHMAFRLADLGQEWECI